MDSYRPNYGPPRPSARAADPMDGNQDPSFHNLNLSQAPAGDFNPQEAIFDTGASHHLTGDKSVLFNFTTLSKPIPLKVATNGKMQFITARGHLHFTGPNGTTVIIKDILFCPFANITLISPAALRLSGFSLSYDCRDDSFNIFSPFSFWVKCPLNLSTRKWQLPPPLLNRYNEVKVIEKKSEATSALIEVILRLETSTGKKLKILRSDNGGEFSSKILGQFLKIKGITAERSIAYHHYQNGAVERFNRTLQETGRRLLLNSGLDRSFWGLAFQWAGMILNRIPNKASGDITPFKKMLGRKPLMDRLTPFGSKAYVHIPAEKRQKLDDRAVEGRVIAYLPNSKGWCFWIPKSNGFINSAVAKFLDTDDKDLVPALITTTAIHPKKNDLLFIVNRFQLGDFSDEILVDQQEALVEALLADSHDYTLPKTYNQALKDKDASEWMTAIKEELKNLDDLGVWDVKLVPDGTRILGARWVFAKKFNDLGAVIRHKARYVAKGYTQSDDETGGTFAPTATFTSMKIVLAIAAKNNWPVHSFDFVAAYLNSPITEEVWVEALKGLDVPKGYACRLKRALYGTKQAARCWWKHLSGILSSLGYKSSQYDTSVYCLKHGDDRNVVWIHVDDGIITGSSTETLQELARDLQTLINIKWSEGIDNIVGLSITRDESGFTLRQPNLTSKILSEQWDGATTVKTPFPTENLPETNPDSSGIDPTEYLSIVGSLSYLAVATRPDISFSVNFLARFSKNPSREHWRFLNHLINYLAGTRDQALYIKPRKGAPAISCFVDANWGGEFSRSTHGMIIFCFGCPVAWISKRLATVASSTAHAEYMAMGIGVREVLWIRNLLCDMVGEEFTAEVFCDNQAAIKVATNDGSNKRTRHTDRDFYISNQAFYHQTKVIQGAVPSSGGVL
ncbi:hypothetical protein MJO29_014989 [Puccinia striiformis f. sp. tritici]|nr:hypothetical protein MJO29_014989 [Puccinia striiformis f. sp. tritici]